MTKRSRQPGYQPICVEVLYFDGCPNWRRAVDAAQRIADDLEIETRVEAHCVADRVDARRLRFLGSPSVRVGGRDIEPGAEARSDYGLACRIYRTDAGFAELPEERWLRAALEAAR